MNIALIIMLGVLGLSLFLGIRAKKGKDMDLEQWAVGGRGFGSIIIFLLVAGEIYTTFTFLGASGWAYGKGGPAFYVLCYPTLAYIISYYTHPAIWKYGKEHKLMSQPDFFVSKFKSQYLGVLVSLVALAAMIPFFMIQLKGLGIIVSVASFGTISSTTAIWISSIAITAYVMISGIHGSAWNAVLKDILVFFVILFIGIYLPLHYYGGIQPMFEAIDTVKPEFLSIPDEINSIPWFISTVLLSAFGFYMWPHAFASIYSAKNEKVFRKNSIVMPIYQLMFLFAIFVGFAAILQVPDLKGADIDMSLLLLSIQTFDPWFVGVIGAAGLLAALVPGSMVLMTTSTLLAKNVYKVLQPAATEERVTKVAKFLVPVVALVSVYFAFRGGDTIVGLFIMAYGIVVQLFPGIIFSLIKNNFVTKQGVSAGICSGLITLAYISITGKTIGTMFPHLPQIITDINIGIIAMIINLVITIIVSILMKNSSSASSNPKLVSEKRVL